MSFSQTCVDSLDVTLTPILIAVTLVLLSTVYYWIKNRSMLPGPKGLPYLGLYPFLTEENVVNKLEKYKTKYGDMFSFTYTGRLYIHLGSIKAMREIHLQKSDCFVDRFKGYTILSETVNEGLLMVNGEPWKILRKFFIQKFKEYGLNVVRNDMAGPLYDCLNAAVDDLKILHKNPINIVEFLTRHSATTMRKILFGEKGATDEEISKMTMAFAGALEGNGATNLLLIGPLAKFLFYTKQSFRENVKQSNTMKRLILDCIKRIETSMNEDETACIVEEFFKERNERRRKNNSSWKYFSDSVLVETLVQFVGDGIASVAGFIAGVFSTLLEYPEEQGRLYSEIMEVIGPNRQPAVEDRPNMPYTNAFLNEYARTTKFLIFFPSLECTKETIVRGYKIPTGAITLMNFWSAHHDEETFEDPNTFKPSRYLNSEGKSKAESPVLFGMGKRICTGEPFVMLQSFLFLTTILKHFKVVSSNAGNDTSIDFLVTGKLELTFVPGKKFNFYIICNTGAFSATLNLLHE